MNPCALFSAAAAVAAAARAEDAVAKLTALAAELAAAKAELAAAKVALAAAEKAAKEALEEVGGGGLRAKRRRGGCGQGEEARIWGQPDNL